MYCPRCMKPNMRQGDVCDKCGAQIPNLTGNRKNKGPKNWNQMLIEEHMEFDQAVEDGVEEGVLRALEELNEKDKQKKNRREYDARKCDQEFRTRLSKMNNDQLISAFNKEVGNTGWTNTRALYLSTLREEMLCRGYDCSAIRSEGGFSYRDEVRLVGNKLILVKK